MVGKLPDLFGVKKGSGDFFEKLGNVTRQLWDTHVLTLAIAIVGHISSGLPSIGVPNAPRSDYVKLLSSGIGITLVGFAAGLSSGMVVNGSPDCIAAVAALLGVTVFDALPELFIGIASSLLLLVYRASRPRIARLGKVAGAGGHYSDMERHIEDRASEDPRLARVYSTVQAAVDAAQRSAS